jgi:hypothetical protein
MTTKSEVAETTISIDKQRALPPHIEAMFGKPPVLSTENRDIYEFIRLDIAQEIRPQTTFEWFWVKDLADLIWEIRRYRSAITLILDAAFKPALKSVLKSMEVPSFDPTGLVSLEKSEASFLEKELFADQWYGSPDDRTEVSGRLAKYGLDAESVAGQAFVLRQEEIRILEILIERAELRRDRILREIGFYRETLAEILDPLTRKMIDGKPKDIPLITQQEAA